MPRRIFRCFFEAAPPAIRSSQALPNPKILYICQNLDYADRRQNAAARYQSWEKLYLLDGRVYAEHSMPAGESVSSDLFLYARCSVVANGREYLNEVLKNPVLFPKSLYFEALLDVPKHAWLRKTGNKLDYHPKYIFETGFNPKGWGADTISL